MNKPRIAIIGYGRFGRLLAKILKPYGEIFILSNHPVETKGLKQIDLVELGSMDWVIPAVPISALEATLKKMSRFLQPGSLVMDVCSVKVYPCRWLKKYIPKNVEIIGSHPMFGPDSAKAGLAGLQVVICPLRQSTERLAQVRAVFKNLGLKITETSPADHDRQAALNLGLVHFIGRALAKVMTPKQDITTLGYERLQAIYENVNNDSWQLFFDMQNFNPYTKKIRSNFVKALEGLQTQINKS